MKYKGLASIALMLALCALACALAPATSAKRAFVAEGVKRLAAEGEHVGPYSTRERRLRIFDEVWEQVRERYFDPSMRGVDWQEVRRSLRPQAAEARDESELYAVLSRMLGSLQDPHTRVFAPGESEDWRVQRYVSVGVAV